MIDFEKRWNQNHSGFPFLVVSRIAPDLKSFILSLTQTLMTAGEAVAVDALDFSLLPAVSNYQTLYLSAIVSVVMKQVESHLLNCPPASLPDFS